MGATPLSPARPENKAKPFYASKTVLFNLAAVIAAAWEPDIARYLSPEHQLLVVTLGNLALRYVTGSPLSLKLKR
jgi:hypothetical protein